MWIPHFGYLLWDQGDNDPNKAIVSRKDTSRRKFEIIFKLEDTDRRLIENSAFTLKNNETKIQTQVIDNKEEKLPMLFEKNDDGKLARVRYQIHAKSPNEALSIAYDALSHLFSFITFASAIPLSIHSVLVVDTKYGFRREAMPQYPAPEEFALPAGLGFDDKFKSIFSLYREGKANQSPFYRFFCFYKILEGFYERREMFREADEFLKKYPEIKRDNRKIDQDLLTWALAYPKYKELENKSFGAFYKWITQSHRHLIAHTFPEKYPQEKWLNLDDLSLYNEFAIIGNITDLVIRALIENEMVLWQKISSTSPKHRKAKTKEVESIYNSIAKKYAELFGNDVDNKSTLNDFMSNLTKDAKVIDLGSGVGNVAAYLKQKGFDVTGVDISYKMIKFAKKKYPGTNFLCADMRDFPYDRLSLDAVISVNAMFHLDKQDFIRLLNKIYKVLVEKGGIFFILREGQGEIYIDEPLLPSKKLFLSLYSKGEIFSLLTASGFKEIKIEEKKVENSNDELPFSLLIVSAKK